MNQKGLIQIIIPIIIILAALGVGYGILYYQTSGIIKEAKQLGEEEKYEEAIQKLGLAQASWFVENLDINKQKIVNEIEENKKLLGDKLKYDEGLNTFNLGNWQEAIYLLSKLPENSFYYQKSQTKIEEAKRKMVEGELTEEKIAREGAEQKAEEEEAARQEAEQIAVEEEAKRIQEEARRAEEELARKIAEQELSEKEAEEQKMSADNDGDGLTYREELAKGTSDWDSDSDGDGIIDSEDTHPAGGGRNVAQTFSWSYGGYDWDLTEQIQEDWYDYYKAKPRGEHPGVAYITSNDQFIKKISEALTRKATSDIPKTWVAIAFVQSLPYVDDMYTGYNEYPKYPVETFFEKNGDCEDTSYLAASIVNAMNIGSVLIVLPGHMAIGVWMDCNTSGTYYKWDNRCYYYVETAGEGWPGGEIPDKYRYLAATLIRVPSGETIKNIRSNYNQPCELSSFFSGYYTDGENFYRDSQCQNLTTCLRSPDDPNIYFEVNKKELYWDSNCTQKAVPGCDKSVYYPGYFYNGIDWYYDSQCIQKARVCRPSSFYYDKYYDGFDTYWDGNCTQRVVPGCSKSIYYPGYFFNGIDYYYDYQCTQKADL